MLDQSFSLKNFRKIYDIDRKNKGTIERDHFAEAYAIRLKINRVKNLIKVFQLKHKKNQLTYDELQTRKTKLNEVIEIRKEKYNYIIDEKIGAMLTIVNAKGYTLPLSILPHKVKNKDVFSIGNKIEDIFVSKQIQIVLSTLFNTKINNRDIIISRLSTLTKELSPKYIIRADVENFYESIDHKKLLDILHSSSKLSVAPKRVITQLIREYRSRTGHEKGLPRGVGISAYLSEIYMSDIDKNMQSIHDVTYYERYVDDMVFVFSPRKKENTLSYLNSISNILNNSGLKLNNKTKEINLYNQTNKNFEYLGYKFEITSGSCSVKIGTDKLRKVRGRIDKSFDDYNKNFKNIPNKSYRLILLRLKFLTGNTQLHNSKSKAFVGVYFSNRFITITSDLVGLDRYLANKLNSINDQKLKNRISKLSFKKGFEEKVFRNFTVEELGVLSNGWKNV